MVVQTHPDKTGEGAGSSDAVQRVQAAEEALKDPTTRARYVAASLTHPAMHKLRIVMVGRRRRSKTPPRALGT